MKKTNVKSKISTIALILLLTISAIIVALPAVSSQTYDHRKTTFAFINATPNPIGVDQQVLLHVGITDFLRDVDHGWEGLTVTVTRPDGETETLGPFRTDSTGGTGKIYVPTMVGTYTLQTHFPEQTYFWTPNARVPFDGLILYEASESEELELVVQQEQVVPYLGMPLPSEYWTRPIDAQLREWNTIAGNWLVGAGRGGIVAPFNDDAPETAHVLWTREMMRGGLVGGVVGDHAMECGDAYSGKFTSSVIVAGILLYNEFATGFEGDSAEHRVCAIDLRTGEKLWSQVLGDNERISFAQLHYWNTMNFHGVFPYVWTTVGSTWKAYDPFTGRLEYTMTNVPRGTRTFGSDGEILLYNVNTRNGWMALWNSSNIPALYGRQTHPSDPNYGSSADGRDFIWGSWYAWGKTVNATGEVTVSPDQPLGIAGYSWNVTIPANLPGSVVAVFAEDKVLGAHINRTEVTSWALSLKPGEEGTLLFKNTWQAPAEWEAGTLDVSYANPVTSAAWEVESTTVGNVFVVWAKEPRKYYGFSMETGAFLWETDSEHYLDIYVGTNRAMYNGNLYSVGYSGIVYCYDLATGETKWTYDAYDAYNEILWGNNWPLRIQFIADGKIYVGMEEHSSVDPKPRGAPYFALDAETGDEIWRANGFPRQNHWGGNSIIGDSVIAAMDAYDQRIYAIGKGPSATTVAAPETSVPLGTDVLITGTVMDVSPGTKDADQTLRFPNGVPAIADEQMSDWMLYVYKQFPKPADVTGVPVKLEAIDPNGNYQDLGTATSDSSGNYGFSFEPKVPGQYMIMATFYGSKAYYGSTTTTYLTVGPAPVSYPTVEIPPYPGYQGPSAGEVAQNVLDNLPDDPTADEIAQEVLDQLPEYAEAPEAPEYTNIFIVIAVAVVVVAALVVYNIYTVRKLK